MGKLFCECETVICICKVCKSKKFVLDPLRKAKEYSRQRFNKGANDLQRGLRLEVAALKKAQLLDHLKKVTPKTTEELYEN